MFNKFAKAVRWSILLGMIYTIYVIAFKDNVEFNNETDEKVLLQMAQKTSKKKEKFLIFQQLHKLHPENVAYKTSYEEAIKVQAKGVIFAHEKMLLPEPKGNYKYIENLDFAKDSNGSFVLVLNMREEFVNLDAKTQKILKSMFLVTHKGIYEHYGFDESFRMLIVPTFDTKDGIEILESGRAKSIVPKAGV